MQMAISRLAVMVVVVLGLACSEQSARPGERATSAMENHALPAPSLSPPADVTPGSKELSSSQLSPKQPALLPASAQTPVERASAWIEAVRVRDLKAIAAMTSYPFAFRDTGATVDCEGLSATAADESQLASALRCPFEDQLTRDALQANPQLFPEETPAKKLPRWTKRYKREIAVTDVPVVIDIPDNGVFIQFVLLIRDDRVHAALRTAVFDPT